MPRGIYKRKKGIVPWSKGKHIQTNTGRTHFKKGHIPWMKGKRGIFKHTEEWKIQNGLRMQGNKLRKGIIPWNKGNSNKWYWDTIKHSREWIEMRKQVFERDNYTCKICKKRGGILHPDHIKPKALYPALMFILDNVRTLCANCHRKTDTYGNRITKLRNLLNNKSYEK